ncbi:MAG: hypothetical protein HY334_07905 [Armatimonadetes bacterium]|nr:hypothetical protein [Armatimonadota bacterium]
MALRWARGAHRSVRAAVRGLGRLREIPSERVLILEYSGAADRAAVEARLDQLRERGLVEFTAPVLRDKASRLRQIPTDEIVIRFHPGEPTASRLRSIQKRYGVTVARQNTFVPHQYVVKVDRPSGLRTLEVAKEIDASEDVEFAAPNFLSEVGR